jgi:two-component system sensor histidine kinase PilS (NtrC family)
MDTPLRRKLLWLITGRAAVVTLLLGSATLIEVASARQRDQLFVLIGLTYAVTAVYALILKYTERHRWLVDVQLAVDAVLVTAVVYLTGGVTSYFSSLYTLPIIAATAVESRRGGVTVAVLSCTLYTGVVLGQLFGPSWLQGVHPMRLPLRLALYTIGLNLFGYIAVASLSGYLAEGLRRAGERLEQASTELADLQAFSQHVIDSLTSGLLTTDVDGRILTFNRAAEAITGVKASAAVGALVQDVLQLSADFSRIFVTAEGRARIARHEFAFAREDGSHIELGLSTAPLVTPRGEIGFLFTFQDVTETRRLEREARVQQRLAAVGEMAAGIAHEIRNPLASMSGSIQILRQDLPLTPDQSQLMDIVLRESERLNDTIRSFLAFARPQRAATTRIDLRQVLNDTARLLQNSPELADTHEIVVDAAGDEVLFEADEGQIRQIVWNLATNGLRAMPDGGRLELSVSRRNPEAGGEVVILVEDQGTGIGPEELDGIFQPFRSAFARGTGLGLSIVHRIVAEYGGEIQVTSERSRGTSVAVRLPLTTAGSGQGTVAGSGQ